MKKILVVVAVLVLFAAAAQAQWSTNGVKIYYNSGNVGIGTSNPSQLLSLYGATKANIYQESAYTGTPAVSQTLASINQVAADGEQFLIAFRKLSDNSHDILQSCYINSLGNFAEFQYFGFATQKWQMRPGVKDAEFVNNGKVYFNNNVTGGVFGANAGAVGIGVTSIPTGIKLAVAGKVACKEVEVTLAYFPDYVFSSDYKLRSLYDVENFVGPSQEGSEPSTHRRAIDPAHCRAQIQG
jgi:hypothetical protein